MPHIDGMPNWLLEWAHCALQPPPPPPPLNVSVHKVCTELYKPQQLPTDCLMSAHYCTPVVSFHVSHSGTCNVPYRKMDLNITKWDCTFNISSHTHILKKHLYWNIIIYLVIKTAVSTTLTLKCTWRHDHGLLLSTSHRPNINLNPILPHTCVTFYTKSEVLRNFQAIFPTPLCVISQHKTSLRRKTPFWEKDSIT